MPEPIRPEDSNIPIASWGDMPLEVISSGDGQGRDDWYGPMAHKLALSEAIHQTFEQDARDQERFDKRVAAYKAARVPKKSEGYNAGVRVEEDGDAMLEPRRSDFIVFDDPDTEIDRLARLIVDGEYRRRAAALESTNPQNGENEDG